MQIKDMIAHQEKLWADAAECALTRDSDKVKRELYSRPAEPLKSLAGEAERVIAAEAKDQTG